MLDHLFKPGSVAVIGASTKELSIGNRVIKNLQDFGYTGPIYPINPKADEVRGIKAYGTILDVPGEVDLVHIVIPNKFVPMAIDDCGKKGVKVVIVNTAGFREIGGEGEELERQVVETAGKHGIRVFGPNCQGIINTDPEIRAYCNFTFTKPTPGHISIVAQSGGVAEVINQRFSELGVGVRMYASNGNACDVSIPEIIRYWGDDPETRVIVLYVEGLSDPKEFMEAAAEVAAKVPILGMKAGRTEEGAKAASSHTGGLARKEIATELIFKRTGILTFRDEEELCQAAVAFASQPIPGGRKVGLITNTGGPAIIATDELVDAGLEIPPLSEGAASTLRESLYEAASISNPIDVLATANAGHFRAAIDVLMAEEHIDSVYINFVTPFFVDTDSIAKEIAEVNAKAKKPIICNLMTDKSQWSGTIGILKDGGVPCYSFPETAARSLVALTRYNELRARTGGEVRVFDDVYAHGAREIIDGAFDEEREFLRSSDVYGILEAYGIPVAPWRGATSTEDAVKAAEEIGFPVVLKAESSSVVHKSDEGGVALDLRDADAVRSAADGMVQRIAADDLEFLVQGYVEGGREVIVGATAEEGLGHLVMVGLGGVYVELLEDVSFAVAPVRDWEAEEMLTSLKASKLLTGFRGQGAVDRDGIIEVIQRVSQLVTEIPEIREIDLNPIIAHENGITVVDARIGMKGG